MSGRFFGKNLIIGSTAILCRLPLIFTLGLLAKSVGPEAYGAWALLLVVQTLAISLGGLGLSNALSRFSPGVDAAAARALLRVAITMGLAAMALILAVGFSFWDLLGSLLNIPSTYRWLLPLVLLLGVGGVVDGYLDAYFKAREQLGRQVGYLLTRSTAEIFAVVSVFASGYFSDPGKALAAYVICILLVKLAVYPLLLRDAVTPAMLKVGDKSEFLGYGRAMLPTLLVIWLTSQVDRVVLGKMISPSDFGVYAFAATLASYLVMLGYAVYPLLLPRASRLFDAGRMTELKQIYARSQLLFLFIIAPALAILALFSREILLLTAGERFAVAPMTFLVLGLAVCLDQLLGIYQYVFHLVKRPRWIFIVNLIQVVLIALGVVALTHLGGAAWAPWGLLVAVVVTNIIRYQLAMRMVDLPLHPMVMAGLPVVLVLTGGLALVAPVLELLPKLGLAALLILCIGLFMFRLAPFRTF